MKKHIVFLSLMIATAFPVSSQESRTRIFGGKWDDYFSSIVSAPAGGYYVLGHTSSHDGDCTGNSSHNSMWLYRLDSTFTPKWVRYFGCSPAGAGWTNSTGVVQTADKCVVATGYSLANDGSFAGMNKGQSDVVVVKVDSVGNTVFKKMIGGYHADKALAIAPLYDGGVIIAGTTQSSSGDFQRQRSETPLGRTDFDAFVLRLDRRGTILWSRVFGGQREDSFNAIAVKDDSTVLLLGSTNSYDGDFEAINSWPYSGSNILLTQITVNGGVNWSRVYGSNHVFAATPSALALSRDGSIYITGKSQGSFERFPNEGGLSTGYEDLFLMKLSSSGDEQWVTRYEAGMPDEGHGVCMLRNGTVAVSGLTYPESVIEKGSYKKDADIVIAIYDSNGKQVRRLTLGGRGSDVAASHMINGQGHIVLIGKTTADQGDQANDGLFLNLGKGGEYSDAFIIELSE
jgi:hypothetical protein